MKKLLSIFSLLSLLAGCNYDEDGNLDSWLDGIEGVEKPDSNKKMTCHTHLMKISAAAT